MDHFPNNKGTKQTSKVAELLCYVKSLIITLVPVIGGMIIKFDLFQIYFAVIFFNLKAAAI